MNQELEPYYNSLTRRQINAYFLEENVCREKFGFSRLTKETYNETKQSTLAANLRKTLGLKSGANRMSSVHSYNILATEHWCFEFNYIPYTYPDREDYIVSMYKDIEMKKLSVDIVRLVSDLAYLPQDRAMQLEFNPKSLNEETKWVQR